MRDGEIHGKSVGIVGIHVKSTMAGLMIKVLVQSTMVEFIRKMLEL